MLKVLLEEAIRLEIPFLTSTTGVRILTAGTAGNRHITGLVVATKEGEHNQFGLGSPRETFPWNLSGTYVQVMPGNPVKAIAHDMVEDAPTRNSMIPVATICQRRETP